MFYIPAIPEPREELTGGFTNIDSDHKLIHDGYGLAFTDYRTLTNAQVFSYSFKAPATRFVHLKNILLQSLGGSIKLEILNGVDVTVDTGTTVPLTNLNDNATNVCGCTMKEAPTFTGGTAVRTMYALADASNKYTGIANLAANPNEEYVTKSEETYYIIRLTNLTTDDIPVAISGFLYSEDKGLAS